MPKKYQNRAVEFNGLSIKEQALNGIGTINHSRWLISEPDWKIQPGAASSIWM